jgi:hypothetical protein
VPRIGRIARGKFGDAGGAGRGRRYLLKVIREEGMNIEKSFKFQAFSIKRRQ